MLDNYSSSRQKNDILKTTLNFNKRFTKESFLDQTITFQNSNLQYPMQNFYLLILFLFCAPIITAQNAELMPLSGNPILELRSAQQQAQTGAEIERLTGFNPFTGLMPESLEDCNDEFDFALVEEGSDIFLNIDTTGLGGGTFGDSLVIDTFCGLNFSEEIFLTGVNIQYNAALFMDNADVKEDTVCVNFHKNGGPVIPLRIPVTIRRMGREIMLPVELIQANETEEFCIDPSALELPSPVECSQIDDVVDDGYDGNDVLPRLFFLTSDIDLCFSYTANAFPGIDEVAVTACDSLGICDVFIIPIEIPGNTIQPAGDRIFFDDFSYAGPYPDPNLWIEDRVFVNNTYAYNPPSVGFATFDGLDRTGTPYDIDFSGVGDRLTSQPIDLSSFDDDSDVYLKFFVQRKGYGLGPSFLDSMYVEFKDNDGDWKLAEAAYPGYTSGVGFDSLEAFQFKAIHIEDDELFHNKFQFRFSSVVSPAGVDDLWHLDYVTLRANSDTSRIFNDVAFTQPPSNVLSRYSSMPWDQFSFQESEAIELQPELIAEIFNHKELTENVDQSSVRIRELETNSDFSDVFSLDFQNIDAQTRLRKVRSMEDATVYGSFVNFMKNIDPGDNDKRILEIAYNFSADQEDIYFRNDTVTTQIIFDDYLAYDDGSPELQVSFPSNVEGGEAFAQKYTLNKADTLTGVRFMFPHVSGQISGQEFLFRVYDEFPGSSVTPIYESATLTPFFVDAIRDTLQGFTTYRIEDIDGEPSNVMLSAGDFWVSFVQLSAISPSIPIGFDRNNPVPEMTNLSDNGSGTFNNFFSFAGALMINPILGGTPFSSSTSEVRALKNVMGIYPNPASDKVNINLLEGHYSDYQIQIFNNLGQLVRTVQLDAELPVDDLKSGLYFLKINNIKTLETFQQKLLITK